MVSTVAIFWVEQNEFMKYASILNRLLVDGSNAPATLKWQQRHTNIAGNHGGAVDKKYTED